jgi:xanthine dehydrogenase iron-sulfur cluster and FAD-binding subunit A
VIMKSLSIAACVWLLAMLGGCAVYTPSGAVVVDPGVTHVHSSRGGFCPPGQAKKGNC